MNKKKAIANYLSRIREKPIAFDIKYWEEVEIRDYRYGAPLRAAVSGMPPQGTKLVWENVVVKSRIDKQYPNCFPTHREFRFCSYFREFPEDYSSVWEEVIAFLKNERYEYVHVVKKHIKRLKRKLP